jgi:hypothetical protein
MVGMLNTELLAPAVSQLAAAVTGDVVSTRRSARSSRTSGRARR